MKRKAKHLFIYTIASLCCTTAYGSLPGSKTAEEIAPYVYPQNVTERPSQFSYIPGGKEYAMISNDGKAITTFDIKTGAETGILVDLTRTRELQIPSMEGFIVSPNASKVIIYRNVQSVYRRSYTAEYYVYDIKSRILDRLSPEFDRVSCPLFSPDSRIIAFVANNDIYLKKLDYNNQVRVTTDGAYGKIINGATDWTYEEEFSTTSLMAWAPDALTLCYVKTDESNVQTYTLPIYEGVCDPQTRYAKYPGIMSYKYPVAGTDNSTVSLHSYDIETRKTKELPLPDSNIEYIPRLDFGPQPAQLMVSTLNRDQNRYELYCVNPQSTVAKSIITEKSQAWICPETYSDMSFQKDGIVMMSNRSGYMHLYKYSYSGALIKTLTSGDYDVTDYYGCDISGHHFYQAALPTPLQRTVYRTDDKKGSTAISTTQGTSSAIFSPDNAYAVMTYSDPSTPPRHTLCNSLGKELRVLVDNARMATAAKKIILPKEFITIPSDGNTLNAFIIKPSDFNPAKKYPVVMTQYSGPASQSVLDRWELDWMYYFARQGFIIVCVDGRGTGGRGNEFMYSVYKDLGHYETIDQINAARYIGTLPGVDATRIGICGWSYGGYEALMCATADSSPFKATVAIAPVTDWRYYDTVYSERFMLTPQQNETGYDSSSPLNRAANLSSELLIMYGTSDDNVHPANSLQFVSKLQNEGGMCDMFIFPNMNHSIYGCNSRAMVYGKMFDFFKKNL